MNERRQEFRELLRLAGPLAAAQAGLQVMSLVDAAVVGRIGAAELGAVGLGTALFFAVSIVAMGFVMGIDPLAAQAIGASDPARARKVLWQGVWLSVVVGLLFLIPVAFTPLLMGPMSIDPAVAREASAYLLIRSTSLVPALVFLVIRGYLQARGITRPMVTAIVVANIVNLFAVILFVYGGRVLPEWTGSLRGFPAMGIAGAALAAVLATIVQVLIVADAVRRLEWPGDEETLRRLRRFDRGMFTQALRIGVPIGLHWGAEVGVFALVSLLAGRLGAIELAAHQVAISLASFTFCVAMGIGAAGSVRVGNAIGAGDHARTRRAGLMAFLAGGGIMALAGLSFLIFPRPLARLITDQPEVIAMAIPLLAVAAFFQISDGIQGVGAGVLRGAGDTRFTFWANIIGHWLIGFPLAFYLGFHLRMGIVGLWWGLCAGLAAVAVQLFVRFLKISSKPILPLHAEVAK